MKKITDEADFNLWRWYWFDVNGQERQFAGEVASLNNERVYRLCLPFDQDVLELTWSQIAEKGISVKGKTTPWGFLRINSDGTSIVYSIDGTVVATHTTNIPTGSGRVLGCGLKIEKIAGITARSAWGSTMNRITLAVGSPTAIAASVWPRSTAWRPPLTTSAT